MRENQTYNLVYVFNYVMKYFLLFNFFCPLYDILKSYPLFEKFV